jgi:hypothetical protein
MNEEAASELERYALANPGEKEKVDRRLVNSAIKILRRAKEELETSGPGAPPSAPDGPLKLTELEATKGQMLLWRYRARKAQAQVARDRAEQAAVTEADALQATTNYYAGLGVDTKRPFDIAPDGTVVYQDADPAPSAPSEPPRYEHEPLPGSTVKRCGGCKDKEKAANPTLA